jgi:hypothetical protein
MRENRGVFITMGLLANSGESVRELWMHDEMFL